VGYVERIGRTPTDPVACFWHDGRVRHDALTALAEALATGVVLAVQERVDHVDALVAAGLARLGFRRGNHPQAAVVRMADEEQVAARGLFAVHGWTEFDPLADDHGVCYIRIKRLLDAMRGDPSDTLDDVFDTWVHEAIHARALCDDEALYRDHSGYEEGIAAGVAHVLVSAAAGGARLWAPYPVATYVGLAQALRVDPLDLWRRCARFPPGRVQEHLPHLVASLAHASLGTALTEAQVRGVGLALAPHLSGSRADREFHSGPTGSATVHVLRVVHEVRELVVRTIDVSSTPSLDDVALVTLLGLTGDHHPNYGYPPEPP
jgi:hypothetical protein